MIELTDNEQEEFGRLDHQFVSQPEPKDGREPLETESTLTKDMPTIETKSKPGRPTGSRSKTVFERKNAQIGTRTGLRAVFCRKGIYFQFQMNTKQLDMKSIPLCLKYR